MINIERNGLTYSFPPNQLAMLAEYTKAVNRPFNKELFKRDENDIIRCLKNIIISAQRNQFFTIQVTGFREIRDYDEIQERLREIESYSNNKRKKFNPYDYINLKDSDVMLLEVFYHLETDEEKCDTSVIIQIPIVINKYYFRINGCMYSSMYQIVDASTYNNTSMSVGGSPKIPILTMKSAFSKTQVIKMNKKITTINKETIPAVSYVCDIFANKICAEKFFLCSMGFYEATNFLGLHNINVISPTAGEILDDDYYYFVTENPKLVVTCPKFLYDNEPMYQSMCYTLTKCITKEASLLDVFHTNYWLESQGAELKTKTVYKGLSFKESFEVSVDLNTYENLRLPPEQKYDAYCVLRWMLQNYNALLCKDNCNLAAKRVRFGEYIAVYYARKIAYSVRRIANLTSKISMKKLKQVVQIKHSFLIDQLKSRCTLINYNNMVNDDDSILGLSYSFKGISGIGENKASAVQTKYKLVNPSHLGRVDMTDSSNSDPGMTGTLVPYLRLYDGYMSDFQEPCNGCDDLDMLYDEYKKTKHIVQVALAKHTLLGNKDPLLEQKEELLKIVENVSKAALNIEHTEEYEAGHPIDGKNAFIEYCDPSIVT